MRREDAAAEEHVVEVGDDEIGVVVLGVDRDHGVHDAGEPADDELRDEPDGEEHGGGELRASRPTSSPSS